MVDIDNTGHEDSPHGPVSTEDAMEDPRMVFSEVADHTETKPGDVVMAAPDRAELTKVATPMTCAKSKAKPAPKSKPMGKKPNVCPKSGGSKPKPSPKKRVSKPMAKGKVRKAKNNKQAPAVAAPSTKGKKVQTRKVKDDVEKKMHSVIWHKPMNLSHNLGGFDSTI